MIHVCDADRCTENGRQYLRHGFIRFLNPKVGDKCGFTLGQERDEDGNLLRIFYCNEPRRRHDSI